MVAYWLQTVTHPSNNRASCRATLSSYPHFVDYIVDCCGWSHHFWCIAVCWHGNVLCNQSTDGILWCPSQSAAWNCEFFFLLADLIPILFGFIVPNTVGYTEGVVSN